MMAALREGVGEHGALCLALGGLLIGALFGVVLSATNFCAMGSLSDIHNFGDRRRFRAWVLAAAVALMGAQLLAAVGWVDLDKSMYLAGSGFNWAGHICGGLLFGLGMVFAGGCPSRNLVRAGGGDVRALLGLVVLGLFAHMTLGGILAPPRAAFEQATGLAFGAHGLGLGHLAGKLTGVPTPIGSLVAASLVAAGALVYCLADARFRSSPLHITSGIAVGLTVVAGWALTGLAFDEMTATPTPPSSLTYVRPTGDALQWLTLYTAAPMPSFGVASVFGALIGACTASLLTGRFRISTFADRGDTLRSLAGAALMGIGGVMGLGCSVGQAISGVSTLALGSFLTFAAIVAGGFYGLRVLERLV
jgi:uncharacterized membrane protein YedE/YeeE